MKKIYLMLLVFMTMSVVFTSCTTDDPFSTATSDDNPRILDPIFPDRQNGQLATFVTISRTDTLNMKLTVTPADYTTVTYSIDDLEVAEGKELKLPLLAGTYTIKIVASTQAGKSTSREGLIVVKPLSTDPYSSPVASERIIAPATKARLLGVNLASVKSLKLGSTVVNNVTYGKDGDQEYLEYDVPAAIAEGSYRVVLVDNAGKEYGAESVTVSKAALVVSGATRANANAAWTLKGINLENVASITVGDKTITAFTAQTSTELTFVCPALSDGDYTVTGKTKDGQALQFYTSTGAKSQITATITSEITLWEGHHYVSWEYPDGNPNKTFNLISTDKFATFKAGSTLRIYYSLEPSAAYHQMQTTTGWWTDLPGTSKIDLTADGVKEVMLTQAALDLIQAQGGFLCVGHGYYVDRVSIQ
jgi:hypothetical protein